MHVLPSTLRALLAKSLTDARHTHTRTRTRTHARTQGLSLGTVAPTTKGGNKKLEYKSAKDQKKKGKR